MAALRFCLATRVCAELPQAFGALLGAKELNPIKVHSDPFSAGLKAP